MHRFVQNFSKSDTRTHLFDNACEMIMQEPTSQSSANFQRTPLQSQSFRANLEPGATSMVGLAAPAAIDDSASDSDDDLVGMMDMAPITAMQFSPVVAEDHAETVRRMSTPLHRIDIDVDLDDDVDEIQHDDSNFNNNDGRGGGKEDNGGDDDDDDDDSDLLSMDPTMVNSTPHQSFNLSSASYNVAQPTPTPHSVSSHSIRHAGSERRLATPHHSQHSPAPSSVQASPEFAALKKVQPELTTDQFLQFQQWQKMQQQSSQQQLQTPSTQSRTPGPSRVGSAHSISAKSASSIPVPPPMATAAAPQGGGGMAPPPPAGGPPPPPGGNGGPPPAPPPLLAPHGISSKGKKSGGGGGGGGFLDGIKNFGKNGKGLKKRVRIFITSFAQRCGQRVLPWIF